MGHKIKVRVTISNGRSEKIAFSIEEGKSFRLNGKLPGMGILSSLVANNPSELLQVGIQDGALVASRTENSPTLVLNGQSLVESRIRKGDTLGYENGKIEFLDVPVFIEKEASTRMVDLEQIDPSTKMVDLSTDMSADLPELAKLDLPKNEQPKAELPTKAQVQAKDNQAASVPNDGATALIMAIKVPSERTKIVATNRAKSSAYKSQASARPRSYQRGNTGSKPKSFLETVDWTQWQHVGISLAIIAFCSEVAARLAFRFSPGHVLIPSPLSGLIAAVIAAAVSWAFFHFGEQLDAFHRFKSYLRSFAWFAPYLIPFGCAFAFPNSVVILACILLSAVWIGLFSIKYFQHLPKFIPSTVAVWLVIFGCSFHFFSAAREPARDVASVDSSQSPADSPAASPSAAAIMPEPAPVVAVAPVAPAPAPAKPATNQEIAAQANTLALDPMAQEQFFNAVKAGNLSVVESLVEKRVVDPVFTLDHGSSALHYAAAQGDLRLVKYLVSKRVNVDAQDSGGTTPLMWAVYKQHGRVVEFLLKKKVNPQIRREGGDRALEIARNGEDTKILSMIRAAMQSRQVASTKNKKRKR